MKLKNVIILSAVTLFILLLILPYLLQPFEVPLNTFFKVSNIDYAEGNFTCIVFISWYGCPYGATDSWILYAFLSHYGKISFNISYSDPNDIYPNTPAIIFLNFTPKSFIHFKFLYLYNRYLNATANGTIVNNFVYYGLEMIKTEFPQFYPYVREYITEKWASGSFFQPVAYMGNPPHIPTFIIISDKKGTYMLIGHIVSPSYFSEYNATYLLKNYNDLSFIQEGVNILEEYIG
ncbi:DUF929 domain-containing protein [Sulfolobus sp. S-194]|uniref:DUF929 domain-containing protein n=1 Tax=Sulfolobus sp. S-194 TaxID=2512240 RepID=UPI0014372E5F|nr:DUF929 domain-containing protein [Sulfolobus sp. S-194]QIW23542.1 DUF929 domain-containing protein [Sulfolobus sp. S-194]